MIESESEFEFEGNFPIREVSQGRAGMGPINQRAKEKSLPRDRGLQVKILLWPKAEKARDLSLMLVWGCTRLLRLSSGPGSKEAS